MQHRLLVQWRHLSTDLWQERNATLLSLFCRMPGHEVLRNVEYPRKDFHAFGNADGDDNDTYEPMQELYNCSCLASSYQPGVPDAYNRQCEAETCMDAIVFLLLFAIVVFLMFVCFTMNISIMLRLDLFSLQKNNNNLVFNLWNRVFFTCLLVTQHWDVIRMNLWIEFVFPKAFLYLNIYLYNT